MKGTASLALGDKHPGLSYTPQFLKSSQETNWRLQVQLLLCMSPDASTNLILLS